VIDRAAVPGGDAGETADAANLAAAARRHGILLMLATMGFFVSADATAKLLTRTYPVVEITWGRFLFHLLLLLPLVLLRGGTVMRSSRLRLQLTRSLFQVGSTVLFFAAIAILPLATATTISFAQPLLLTMLSIPLLGEKVGPRRWAAVLVGFVGVIIIIRPTGVVQWAALLPLGTAGFSAIYQLVTRLVARIDPVETSLFYTGVGGFVLTSLALPFVWQAPDAIGWLLMALMGVLSGVGHYCIIHAYQRVQA
jgi:drug/metabolite transporter (DMT)-like permease